MQRVWLCLLACYFGLCQSATVIQSCVNPSDVTFTEVVFHSGCTSSCGPECVYFTGSTVALSIAFDNPPALPVVVRFGQTAATVTTLTAKTFRATLTLTSAIPFGTLSIVVTAGTGPQTQTFTATTDRSIAAHIPPVRTTISAGLSISGLTSGDATARANQVLGLFQSLGVSSSATRVKSAEFFRGALVMNFDLTIFPFLYDKDVISAKLSLVVSNGSLQTQVRSAFSLSTLIVQFTDQPVIYANVPNSWTCLPEYYGSADGCDCGCGVVDTDCSNPLVTTSFENCPPGFTCARAATTCTSAPVCLVPRLENVLFSASCVGLTDGEACETRCSPGFTARGTKFTTTCVASANRQTAAFTGIPTEECVAQPCDLSSVSSVQILACSELSTGERCSASCADGYAGDSTTVGCAVGVDGTPKLFNLPTCTASRCNVPEDPAILFLGCEGRHTYETCEARCNRLYTGATTFPACTPVTGSALSQFVNLPVCIEVNHFLVTQTVSMKFAGNVSDTDLFVEPLKLAIQTLIIDKGVVIGLDDIAIFDFSEKANNVLTFVLQTTHYSISEASKSVTIISDSLYKKYIIGYVNTELGRAELEHVVTMSIMQTATFQTGRGLDVTSSPSPTPTPTSGTLQVQVFGLQIALLFAVLFLHHL